MFWRQERSGRQMSTATRADGGRRAHLRTTILSNEQEALNWSGADHQPVIRVIPSNCSRFF
jgi:hypothetical protein